MFRWLRRMFDRRSVDLASVEPENPAQARTLHRADALLAHPRIRALEAKRRDELRGSFVRADRRLAGR